MILLFEGPSRSSKAGVKLYIVISPTTSLFLLIKAEINNECVAPTMLYSLTSALVCSSLQEARKTMRWRPHIVFKYFQSHCWPLTKNPRNATLVSLRKFSQGDFKFPYYMIPYKRKIHCNFLFRFQKLTVPFKRAYQIE